MDLELQRLLEQMSVDEISRLHQAFLRAEKTLHSPKERSAEFAKLVVRYYSNGRSAEVDLREASD